MAVFRNKNNLFCYALKMQEFAWGLLALVLHLGFYMWIFSNWPFPVSLSQAVTGHEECVEALLQHGAKSLLRDCRGRTPIHLSAACGHIGVLGALLQSASSVDAAPAMADNHGYTSLHWACYNGKMHKIHL